MSEKKKLKIKERQLISGKENIIEKGLSSKLRSEIRVKRFKHYEHGVTLISLVVTIIVLLILASVTISAIFSDNGIIKKAQEAANKTKEAIEQEQAELNQLYNDLASIMNNTTGGSTTPEEPTVPSRLEIGSTVTYNPSGTYNWQAKYCSSTKTETTDDVTLNSSTGEDFNISSWKVLSIDNETGTVELVPSAPTTGTVYLGEAQGYNNGVKLLNDACSSLYGNNEKEITARSINIEDIEKYMTDTALTEAHNYTNSSSNTKYGNQVSSAYSTSNSLYPAIYAQEKLAVINGEANGDTGLDLSKQDAFIERTEGTNGAIATATSIQPYQTYWYKDPTFMSTAFEDYTKQDSSTANYYNLIMPSGTGTTYWVASRCVLAYSSDCLFLVRVVDSGGVIANDMFGSNDDTGDYSLALFPVITLNSSLIEGDASTGFSVK